MPPMYDPEAVRPMWEELVAVGIEPLTTPEAVDEVLGVKQGTVLVVLNSVCGCAAGNCRPGTMLALQNDRIPDKLVTVFAGMDTEAVQQLRTYLDYQPSSPNIALFKDGELVLAMQRFHIERMSAVDIGNVLVEAFNEHCSRSGPSVPPEVFDQVSPVKRCGSSLPLYQGD